MRKFLGVLWGVLVLVAVVSEQAFGKDRQRLPFEPEVVLIPGGTFSMGCVSGKGCDDAEKPVHRVTVSPFYMSKYETTFAQWDACVKDSGCKHKPKDEGWGRGKRPVINVSWNDANVYAKWLSDKTGETWRLPTEAEWEYAARAGSQTKYSFGNSEADLCKYGNHADRSTDFSHRNTKCSDGIGKQTAIVGSYLPNKFGLFDMNGNVWEAVLDWKNKLADHSGNTLSCGGGWRSMARGLHSTARNALPHDFRYYNQGFRLMRQLP